MASWIGTNNYMGLDLTLDETSEGKEICKSYERKTDLLCFGFIRMIQNEVASQNEFEEGITKILFKFMNDPPKPIQLAEIIKSFYLIP